MACNWVALKSEEKDSRPDYLSDPRTGGLELNCSPSRGRDFDHANAALGKVRPNAAQ